MSTAAHLFIHPWLNSVECWAGFQLAFAGDEAAYASALAALAADPRIAELDSRLPWTIPVPGLASLPAAAAFPGQNAVLLFDAAATKHAAPEWSQAEEELRLAGRRLGLALGPAHPLPPTGAWHLAVLDAGHARTLPPFTLLGLAVNTSVALTGLHSRSEHAWAAANRCSLLSGEYLFRRSPPSRQPDIARLRMLKLLGLIVEDADTREIEEIFRQEPKLAYGLLRLVNSAAMALRGPVSSFSQAIALLGRQQLQRWLQLLVYADPDNAQRVNPLLLAAATRGRLMEILAGATASAEPGYSPDTAFMIGAFSLLDILFNLPMQDILAQLPLPDYAHAALGEHRGPLGQLLAALAAADLRDHALAAGRLGELGIDAMALCSAQLDALAWANSIRQTM